MLDTFAGLDADNEVEQILNQVQTILDETREHLSTRYPDAT